MISFFFSECTSRDRIVAVSHWFKQNSA